MIEVAHDWSTGRTIAVCQAHAALADDEIYDVVLNGENRRKNSLHKELIENDALGLSIALPDGSRSLSPDVTLDWSFEGSGRDRELRYSVVGRGVDQAKADAIRAAVDARLGSGRASFRGSP